MDGDCSHEIKRRLLLGRKAMTNLDKVLKKRDITLLTKVQSSLVWMWELDHKEGLASKNRCFWNVVQKTFKSSLDCKEIKSVNLKGNQPWIFSGRTDAKAEAPILWPPGAKSWLTGRNPNAGKDWGQEEKGARGWDGWMASLTQWTWVWACSRRQWRTGKPGVLQFMGLQRVGYDLVTEQQDSFWLWSSTCPPWFHPMTMYGIRLTPNFCEYH